VRSASARRRDIKYNPKKNPKNNPKNNPINNPKSNKKKKLALRATNLQAVQDDPTILQTHKMSTGTSASVSVLTYGDWVVVPALLTHWTHCLLTGLT